MALYDADEAILILRFAWEIENWKTLSKIQAAHLTGTRGRNTGIPVFKIPGYRTKMKALKYRDWIYENRDFQNFRYSIILSFYVGFRMK